MSTVTILKDEAKGDSSAQKLAEAIDVNPPTAQRECKLSTPEPNETLTTKQLKARNEKESGNAAYKKKDFAFALECYVKAVELDPKNIIYYLNIAAVYFEQKEYVKCVEMCEKAVVIGRYNGADLKKMSKAMARIGNAYTKMEDWRTAKVYFEKSLSLNKTPEVERMVSQIDTKIKCCEIAAYIDPVKVEKVAKQQKELFNKDLVPKQSYDEILTKYIAAEKKITELQSKLDFQSVLLEKLDSMNSKIDGISSMNAKLASLEAMLYMKEVSKSVHTVIHRSIKSNQYKSKLKLKTKEDSDNFLKDVEEFDQIDEKVIRQPRNNEIHVIGELRNQSRTKIQESATRIGLTPEQLRVF